MPSFSKIHILRPLAPMPRLSPGYYAIILWISGRREWDLDVLDEEAREIDRCPA